MLAWIVHLLRKPTPVSEKNAKKAKPVAIHSPRHLAQMVFFRNRGLKKHDFLLSSSLNEYGMLSRRWTASVLLKYMLFQLPELAVLAIILLLLETSKVLSTTTVWIVIILWIIKDAALYPFVWQAYDFGRHQETDPIIGQIGSCRERLDPSGYISVRGELWKAVISDTHRPIEKGQSVRVIGNKGLTLFVIPEK